MIRRDLFTAVVGDVMDAAGLTNQFLPPHIRPLSPDMVVIGRAIPVLGADSAGAYVADEDVPKPFGLMLDALDDLKPGEVYVSADDAPRYAPWGGLMTTRATHLRAAGAVLDGCSRDTREITEFGLLPHLLARPLRPR